MKDVDYKAKFTFDRIKRRRAKAISKGRRHNSTRLIQIFVLFKRGQSQ